MPRKIVSGVQTVADRAALDAAIEMGMSHRDCVPNFEDAWKYAKNVGKKIIDT